jgi:hypothetical protein
MEKRELLHTMASTDLLAIMNTNMEVHQKILIEPPIPVLGIYPKEMKSACQRNISMAMLELFTIAKKWKQP